MARIGRHGERVGTLAILFMLFLAFGAKAQQPPLITLPGHMLPALSRAQPAEPIEAATLRAKSAVTAPITLTVVLRRSDPAGFGAYLQDVYNPESANFRKFLSPTQVTERFGPSQSDYDAVRAHFEAQGFTLGEGSANRLTLMLNGTRTAAATALRVNIREYRIGEQQFFANDAEPALPVGIARRVEAVIGLSNLAVPAAASDFRVEVGLLFCQRRRTAIGSITGGQTYKDGLVDKSYGRPIQRA